MSIDARVEIGVLPNNRDIALVHQLFRIPEATIENPSVAPPVLFLDKFWELVPKDVNLTRQWEMFLGFDQAPNGSMGCAEISTGDAGSVKQKSSHLLGFHTEPYQPKEELNARTLPIIDPPLTDIEVIAHNFPQPYLPDLRDLLQNTNAYAEIVFRFGEKDSDPFAGIVVIKTRQWKSKIAQQLWWELKHEIRYTPNRPFKYTFAEDKFVTEKLGLAVYRGFVSIPPTATEPLRLRR